MQDNIVFEGSVSENIDPENSFSSSSTTSIAERIDSLNLSEILHENRLELSYHLEEAGKNLSQGEKQVISLVRALVQQKPIILFDEANSNIDSKNEAILTDFLFSNPATV